MNNTPSRLSHTVVTTVAALSMGCGTVKPDEMQTISDTSANESASTDSASPDNGEVHIECDAEISIADLEQELTDSGFPTTGGTICVGDGTVDTLQPDGAHPVITLSIVAVNPLAAKLSSIEIRANGY